MSTSSRALVRPIPLALLLAFGLTFAAGVSDKPQTPAGAVIPADRFESDVAGAPAPGTAEARSAASALRKRLDAAKPAGAIAVDSPFAGAIFPPDMCAPTLLFRDTDARAARWVVRITVPGERGEIFVLTGGRKPDKVIDPRTETDVNDWRESPEEAAQKACAPSAEAWAAVSRAAGKSVLFRVYGLTGAGTGAADLGSAETVSLGRVEVSVSPDPVGAPIFYRDVPLMPSRNVKGVIEPLAQSAVPLVCWRLRDLREPESRVVLKTMPTCGNCHSFSADGRVLGMDMDGPSGDKGAYAVLDLQPETQIKSSDVISWNWFDKDHVTFGLFSRVSPDGRRVLSCVEESVYVANYLDIRFLQTFYPVRGVVACYDRDTRAIRTLPGADDPAFVQANPVWSPDGRTVAFLRAPARDAYEDGRPLAVKANDPNETQIRYDIYTIPWNDGKGGAARPLAGASANGMSNSFPKYSPDGRWIVYVRAKNGLLMRPDSELWIVPAEGGAARRMECNLPVMNSWHSWSPNGRWLVFASKSPRPFTQMYLAHVDADGRSAPPVLVPRSTADNRAVNIPEFVNLPPGRLREISVPAVEYRVHLDRGEELLRAKDYENALAALEKARELKPDYAKTLSALGYGLGERGDLDAAIRSFRESITLDRFNIDAYVYLGNALLRKSDVEAALTSFRAAVELNPMHAAARAGLANGLTIAGRLEEAVPHFERAIEIDPENLDAKYNFGLALTGLGRAAGAAPLFRAVLEKRPEDAKAHGALGAALNRLGDPAGAVKEYERSLALAPGDLGVMNNLAWILATTADDSLRDGRKALALARTVCERTRHENPAALDTLAAALAETGSVDEAVRWAGRSVELTPAADPQRASREALFESYKRRKAG